MEISLTLPAICLVLTLIAGRSLSTKVTRWLSRRALIRKYGCKEPPQLPLDLAVINQKAAKEHKLLETTTQLFQDYGKTYKAKRSGRTIVRTCDPKVFKAVLSTHFENFGMQPIRYEEGKGFFGNGMLVTDGPQWKHSRALIRPVFDIAHVANFDRLSAHVGRFMELIPRDGATIDLYPLLKRLVRITLLKLYTILTTNRLLTSRASLFSVDLWMRLHLPTLAKNLWMPSWLRKEMWSYPSLKELKSTRPGAKLFWTISTNASTRPASVLQNLEMMFGEASKFTS
jgi:hypothetical protein